MARSSTTFERGHTKVGGRRKGSVDKKVAARRQLAAMALQDLGLSAEEIAKLNSIAVMELVMHARLKAGDHSGALMAAAELAPYQAPRLSASAVAIRTEHRAKSDAEIEAEIRTIEARLRLTVEAEAADAGLDAARASLGLADAEPDC